MSFTYDTQTQIGLVRMIIPDRNQATALFTDEEISAMISLESGGHLKRVAALALETIASDRTMVLQVITTNGLSTDGAAVARALTARSKMLREQAMEEESAQSGGAFDWAEQVTGSFSYRERNWAEIMRDNP